MVTAMRQPRDSQLHRKFCVNLREKRKLAGLTQVELANAIGMSQPQYTNVELGKNIPGLDVVERVAKALRIDPAELLS